MKEWEFGPAIWSREEKAICARPSATSESDDLREIVLLEGSRGVKEKNDCYS